ncbi:hypothetical protein A5676_05690 [Mycobacterium malmoense]|nr:hypothetical protein A5676_05690 [Mycobacterium malmoense]
MRASLTTTTGLAVTVPSPAVTVRRLSVRLTAGRIAVAGPGWFSAMRRLAVRRTGVPGAVP